MAKTNKKPATRAPRATLKSKSASKPEPKTAPKASRSAKTRPLPAKPESARKTKPSAPVTRPAVNSKPAPVARSRPAVLPVANAQPQPLKARPGKNLAGLNARELEHFRELLLMKRRELVGDMYSMEREALSRTGENLSNLPIHMADMGTDNYEQEFTLGLMEKDRQLLREINSALMKIQNGTYGICEGTSKPISKARLEVQPWARFSIEHARKLESRGTRA